MRLNPDIYILFKALLPPITETLTSEPRWSSEKNSHTALERMMREEYSFMAPVQAMYIEIGEIKK